LGVIGRIAFSARHPDLKAVFHDPYAERIFARAAKNGAAILASLKTWDDVVRFVAEHSGGTFDDMVARGVWRKRWIEQRMREALGAGALQAVILGGGFDTIALRLAAAVPATPIFEIDQSGTQAIKRRIVDEVVGAPANLTWVAVDFARERMEDRLLATGYDPKLPSVFLAEVVLEYLPPAEADGVFAFVRRHGGAASRFVFSFLPPGALVAGTGAGLGTAVTEAAEPFRFMLEPAAVDGFLAERGFRRRSTVTLPQVRDEYVGSNAKLGAALPPFESSLFHYVDAEKI
jgi:methyltransferase (TIGR00027 family)